MPRLRLAVGTVPGPDDGSARLPPVWEDDSETAPAVPAPVLGAVSRVPALLDTPAGEAHAVPGVFRPDCPPEGEAAELTPLRAIDLFCGAGGASMGLHRAGFDVTGVDIVPQPHYPFRFIQADALTVPLDGYDLIWASPPCQAFTAYRRRGHVRPALNRIPATRRQLRMGDTPYVIENVVGAPLRVSAILCGSMFGLGVRRHRLFECSFPVGLVPPCNHKGVAIPNYAPPWFRERWQGGYPAATNRVRRNTVEVGVYRIDLETQRIAMDIDWMNRQELSQAIPPAYAEWLARALLRTAAPSGTH